MNDEQRLDWLDSFLTYSNLVDLFGYEKATLQGDPRNIRTIIDMCASDEYYRRGTR